MTQINTSDWYWDELHRADSGFESDSDVAAYDMSMRNSRDIDGENAEIMSMLNLAPDARVLEIGTATGAFARLAAHSVHSVRAVDISPAMLHYAENCARSEGLRNIVFERAGFLTFHAEKNSLDAIVSRHAFHHLPDLWKAVALSNIRAALKPGGKFLLFDVVFTWHDETPEDYFKRIVEAAAETQINFTTYFSHEYSTFDWILRGMMERSGFRISEERYSGEFRKMYCCTAV